MFIGDSSPIFRTKSQNNGEIYKPNQHYLNLKEMLIPYMFSDRSGDISSNDNDDYQYGYQSNERMKELSTTWSKLINGINNRDEQQRVLGVTYMR